MFKNSFAYFHMLNICLRYVYCDSPLVPVSKRGFAKDLPGDTNTTSEVATVKSEMMDVIEYTMESLCPYGDFCQINRTVKNVAPIAAGYEPCCKDCSCSADCGKDHHKPCCFPSYPNHDLVPTPQLTCTSIASTQDPDLDAIPSYYMVSNCPNDNSQTDKESEDIVRSCIENKSWRSLEPVFSKSMRLIFKNKYCAQCHNVSDLISWQQLFVCTYLRKDIFYELSKNELSPECYIHQKYPGNHSDIQHSRCCLDTSYAKSPHFIPEIQNISHTDMKSYCESGFYSPYTSGIIREKFANIFCYLCNKIKSIFHVQTKCTSEGNGRSTKYGFFSIVDHSVLNDVKDHTEMQQIQTRKQACRTLDSNKMDCRQLFCPIGQIFNQAGECVYFAKQWTFDSYHISLKLVPETSLDSSVLDVFRDNNYLMYLKHSWPDRWSITCLFAEIETCSVLLAEKCVSYIGVTLSMRYPNRVALNVIARVKNMVKTDWYMQVNSTSFRLKPQFLDLNTNQFLTMESFQQKSDTSITMIVLNMEYTSRSVLITRFFYCKQIALRENEYMLESAGGKHSLYLNESGRLLFPQQYNLKTGSKGDQFPTLCLSETLFREAIKSSYPQLPSHNCIHAIVFLVVFHIL